MSQHTNTLSTASGHHLYVFHVLLWTFATVLISMIFIIGAKADKVICTVCQAMQPSQNEMVVILLFFVTYLAGFAKSRCWSVCARTVPKVRSPRHSGPKAPLKVTVRPTKAAAAKVNLPTAEMRGQWDADARLLKTADRGCLPTDASSFSDLVGACARLDDVEMALALFDHMLENGIRCDPPSVHGGSASKFFKLVATNLGDERMREDGVRLLQAILAHGMSPTHLVQNQLIRAWKSKLPHHVVEAFVNLRDKGGHLSGTAYRCVMASHERSEPVFTLRLYDEMLQKGVKVDRVAFNAVLCACSHLGMTSQALGLFQQMAGLGLVPNGKTYGTLIRACTSTRKLEEALELFESMRGAGIEPNRFAFRDAIHCCVKLNKFDEAYALYKDLVEAGAVHCSSTCVHIMEACRKNGYLSVADRIQADMAAIDGPVCHHH